ncbi:SH3 domain-containing protein [Streptomyces kronopolitis]|uniref:SH3 domain-containing protein n=1 Tax=Streptomyces TaxID=1883 RepID=UPI0020BDCCBF|nr:MULTISPECIES: SH3 domain-containing protein [Streptomyces]MCL6297797.1 SH3 domain-containing protein [Streptomyces kronopolitis]GLW19134.1 hypothetical protein Stsp01_58770 [Streptomyces sp. NBRC 13847]
MNRRMLRNAVVTAVAAFAMVPAVAVADSCPHPAYLGTAATSHTHAHGRAVTPNGMALNVRSGPGTGYRVVGTVRNGSVRGLVCKTDGSRVQGTTRWYKLRHHRGYVSAHYVRAFRALPWCRVTNG